MASIITEKYRKTLSQFINADRSSSNYYIGLGKSDEWYEDLSNGLSAPFPIGTTADCNDVLANLTDLIKIQNGDFARVIPVAYAEASGFYKQFDAYDAACLYPSSIGGVNYKPAYFIDQVSGYVYIIIYSPENSQMTLTSQDNINLSNGGTSSDNEMFRLSSGHVVVRVGQVVLYSKFNNEQFVEIDTTLDTSSIINYKGCVYGLHLANGGQYDVTNGDEGATINIYGIDENDNPILLEGEINASCNFTNGVITLITINSGYYDLLLNRNYESTQFKKAIAKITVSGIDEIIPATIYPCISNLNGFKYDVTEYTPSWYVCFLTNSRTSEHDVYSKYSQVSLVRAPQVNGTTLTTAAQNMKKSFTLTAYDLSVLSGGQYAIEERGSTDVKYIGVLDSYNNTSKTVYYTNSPKYGYSTPGEAGTTIAFIDIETGSEILSGIRATSVNAPTVTSGDVMFIDNRASITRSEDQNEELKIIIQL